MYLQIPEPKCKYKVLALETAHQVDCKYNGADLHALFSTYCQNPAQFSSILNGINNAS